MATDNLMPQSSTSIIKHFMLRSSTTGQGLTGKVYSDFSGKYNIAGGAEVTLSFSSGAVGDAYSSGKIVPLGLGKYAWHVPNAVFASLGNVSAVLSVTGGIDVHCEWLVVADSRDLATKPVNVTQFGGTNGTFASGVPDVKVASMAANALTAAAISADAGAELAALVETYIVNEGDATAVMQAIADKIAADWVAGDASPLAIASAVWAAGSRTITGGSLTTSPPTTSEILTALGTGSWATSLASQSSVTQIVNALPASGHLAGSADSNGAAELDSAEREAIADEVESRELTLTAAYDAAKTAASQTAVNDVPTVAEFEARTLASAEYATAAQINSLNVNTRANISVPIEIETPDSGTQIYKVRLFLFDVVGNMEAPDSEPTVALVNAAGIDRASRLSAASNPSDGVYSWDYTATDDDAEEQLNWTFTVVEGGLSRVYPATSYVVEETAYRFTSTDRATLNSRASQTSLDAVSTKIGSPVTSVSADIAAVKADTDSLLTRVTSGITALIANLTAMITGSGASAKYTVGALSNAPSGGGGGSGTESDLMVSTTIAALSSQTVFTLTDGSPDNDAYNDQLVVITDADTSTQKSRGIVSDYVASTKTITLRGAPGFTIAAGDAIAIIAIGSDVSSTQLAGAVSSAIATAGVPVTVTGVPSFLRVGDARTVANGSAIPVRLYSADDDSLLFGLGTQLFEDATITFSLRRSGNDGNEGAEEAVIPCTWVASGSDGYVLIAYEGDALDGCDAMDKVKEKDCHRWGIKFQWGTDDPITPVYGNVSVLRKIVSTQ